MFFVVMSIGFVDLRAQSEDGQIRFSVQLNPAYSWIRSSSADVEATGGTFGVQTGLFAEYGISDRISLVSGLRLNVGYGGALTYARAGTFWPTSDLTDESFRELPADVGINYRSQFIEIPVGFIYYTGELGSAGMRAYVQSPTFSLLLSTRAKGEAPAVGTGSQNILDDVRFLNFGLGFGAGVIPNWIEGADVRLGLSYQTMFSDLLNDGTYSDGQREDSKAKLGVLSFNFVLLL